MLNLALALFVALCTVGCQPIAKRGVMGMDAPPSFEHPMTTLWAFATSGFIVTGPAVQGFGFVIWLHLVSEANLTWALTLAGAALMALTRQTLCNEGISVIQWAGLPLINRGAFLVTRRTP